MSSRVSNWLASGRTPSTWQREMAQNTAWLKALSSASTWTEELIALQPMLNNEPLLGRSLALLTTEFTRQAQTPSGAAHETRVRPARMQSPRGQQGAQGYQRLPKLERPFTGNNEMPPRQTGTDFSARRSAAVHKSAHFPGDIEHGQLTTRQRGERANTSRMAELDRQINHSLLSRWAGNSPVTNTAAARPR